ncbi:hypothetical protein BMS3Abin13_00066 [bacterium BMS3Abin13]|nr:hypothetical protein BMS3Abin13_00066 [bacterium BMS3Abin13]
MQPAVTRLQVTHLDNGLAVDVNIPLQPVPVIKDRKDTKLYHHEKRHEYAARDQGEPLPAGELFHDAPPRCSRRAKRTNPLSLSAVAETILTSS